jgi:hypothetical protein
MTQQPTVGRIVLVPVHPAENNGQDFAPAIITRVWNPETINARVFCDSTNTQHRTSLRHVDELPHDEQGASGFAMPKPVWAWPPRV